MKTIEKIEVMPHSRHFQSVKEEGHIFGRYYSKTEYVYSVGATLYIEYMKRWGDKKKIC